MKKTISILLSGLIMMTSLASCDNSSSSIATREDWSESEVESIKTALRDVTLPFFKLSNEYTLQASTRSGTVIITMENATVTDLKNIEKAFKADADWEIADEIGSSAEQPYLGTSVYATETINISGVEYAVVSQYGYTQTKMISELLIKETFNLLLIYRLNWKIKANNLKHTNWRKQGLSNILQITDMKV